MLMDRIDPALLPLGTVLKLLASPEFSLMRSSRKNLNSSFCSGSADCAPISAPPIGTMEQGGLQFRWRQVNGEWTPNHTVEEVLAAFWTTPDTKRGLPPALPRSLPLSLAASPGSWGGAQEKARVAEEERVKARQKRRPIETAAPTPDISARAKAQAESPAQKLAFVFAATPTRPCVSATGT